MAIALNSTVNHKQLHGDGTKHSGRHILSGMICTKTIILIHVQII